MKLTSKIALALIGTAFPYMCAVIAFAFYLVKHPGSPAPQSISISLLCFFILTIVAGSFIVSRVVKKQTRTETPEQGHLRRLRAIKGLKLGFFVWGVILLNDIRMLLQRTMPWTLALPGLAVVLAIVVTSWLSIKRLQKAEGDYVGSRRQQVGE